MHTFNRAKLRAVAFCGLFTASLAYAQATEEPSCRKETILRIAGRDQVITLDEAERIRRTVETYLAEEKPDLDPSVVGPGEAFIDCRGTVRLGAWILESASTDEPELHLTYRISTSERFIVRQIVSLALEEGRWKVTGVGLQTAHRRY